MFKCVRERGNLCAWIYAIGGGCIGLSSKPKGWWCSLWLCKYVFVHFSASLQVLCCCCFWRRCCHFWDGCFFVFCHVPLSLLLIRGIFSQAVVIRVQYSTPEPVLRVALERISGLANSFLPLVKSVMIHFKYPKRIKNWQCGHCERSTKSKNITKMITDRKLVSKSFDFTKFGICKRFFLVYNGPHKHDWSAHNYINWSRVPYATEVCVFSWHFWPFANQMYSML